MKDADVVDDGKIETLPPTTVQPLLTVITVCLNRADTIAMALDSVARQLAAVPSGDIEHLVIDGGSTDGTLAVAARFTHARVLSEADCGLYDAMNKGVGLATGRYVCFLNSDDALADGVIAAVRPFMLAGHDAICTGTDFVRDGAQGRREVIETLVAPDAIVLSPATATLGSPLLNAKFFRRDFLRSVGPFDLRYRLASDVDLLLRAALARPRIAVLPMVGHHYMEHAGSLTINPAGTNHRRAAEECLAIAEKSLARADLPPRVRFLLRAWRGAKCLTIARIEGRHRPDLMPWLMVLKSTADVVCYLQYLVQRKMRSPAQRLAADAIDA